MGLGVRKSRFNFQGSGCRVLAPGLLAGISFKSPSQGFLDRRGFLDSRLSRQRAVDEGAATSRKSKCTNPATCQSQTLDTRILCPTPSYTHVGLIQACEPLRPDTALTAHSKLRGSLAQQSAEFRSQLRPACRKGFRVRAWCLEVSVFRVAVSSFRDPLKFPYGELWGLGSRACGTCGFFDLSRNSKPRRSIRPP